MSIPVWSTDLPNTDSSGFSGKRGAVVEITKMDSGRTRIRDRFGVQIGTYSVQWTFTIEQYEDFKTFFTETLLNGVSWFMLPVPEDSDLTPAQVRFSDATYSFQYVEFMNVQVSAQLDSYIAQVVEAPETPVLPVFYQPVEVVTVSREVTAADKGRLFDCQPPTSGAQILITKADQLEDLTAVDFGFRISGANPGSVLYSSLPVNSPPLPKTDNRSMAMNTPVVGDASTTDPDLDTITYSMGTVTPNHGAVSGINASTGAYTYTPTTGYTGADNFTIAADDGNGGVTQIVCIMSIVPPVISWQTLATNAGAWAVYDPAHFTNGGNNANGDPSITALLDQTGNGNNMTDSQALNARGFIKTFGSYDYICSLWNATLSAAKGFRGLNSTLATTPLQKYHILAIFKKPTGAPLANGQAIINVTGTTTDYFGFSENVTSGSEAMSYVLPGTSTGGSNFSGLFSDRWPAANAPYLLELGNHGSSGGSGIGGFAMLNTFPAFASNGASSKNCKGLALGCFHNTTGAPSNTYCMGVVIFKNDSTRPTLDQINDLRKAMIDQSI